MSSPSPLRLEEQSKIPVTIDRSTVDVRSVALAFIALVTMIAVLRWAKAVFIPLTLSVALSYALMPGVDWLRRRVHLPISLGAGLVLIALTGGLVGGVAALEPQAISLLDLLPKVTRQVQHSLQNTALDRTSIIQKLTSAADALEHATQGERQGQKPAEQPPPAQSTLGLQRYLLSASVALLTGLGQAVIVIALTYFLLVSGHSFKRKVVRLSGDTLSRRKITVQILDEIDQQIQRYLLIQLGTSVMVGLLSGIAFAWIGLQNAVLWAVAAAVLHLIPYVGPTLIIAATSLLAYVQFGSLAQTLWVAGSSLAITGVIGLGITPWMTEKVGRINAVATFVALIFWEWVWGIPGLLLGIPIMMIVMAVCERIEGLRPVAELLGQENDELGG